MEKIYSKKLLTKLFFARVNAFSELARCSEKSHHIMCSFSFLQMVGKNPDSHGPLKWNVNNG